MTIKRFALIIVIIVISVVLLAVVRLILLKKDVGDYKAYWQQRAAQPVADGAIVYVAIGDSGAQGIGASHPEKSYVHLVANHLATKFQRPVHVINLSVSGARVRDVLSEQLKQYRELGVSADIMTVEIGANDMIRFDEGEFRSQFTDLLAQLPDGALVANVPSFKNGRLNKLAGNSQAASSLVDDLLEKTPRLKRADLQGRTNSLGVLDFAADLFHPSDRAYKKWASAFTDALDNQQELRYACKSCHADNSIDKIVSISYNVHHYD